MKDFILLAKTFYILGHIVVAQTLFVGDGNMLRKKEAQMWRIVIDNLLFLEQVFLKFHRLASNYIKNQRLKA